MPAIPKYLILQIRKESDPMLQQEVECFAWALDCDPHQIAVHDVLAGGPSAAQLNSIDVVLVGGSGDYSTTVEAEWLERAMDVLRQLHDDQKPLFGSCWGFQALARAFGGVVRHDLENAELGTHEVFLTGDGRTDPVFGGLADDFRAQMGHEDRVVTLPPNAVLLASSDQVANQALRFDDAPVYATQFHPELKLETYLERVRSYPKYVQKITGQPYVDFARTCAESPETKKILPRFVQYVLG